MTFDRFNVLIGCCAAVLAIFIIFATVARVTESNNTRDADVTRAKLAACARFERSSKQMACVALAVR